MSLRIFDVGLGTIIISGLWVICTIGFVSTSRKQGITNGLIYLFLGTMLTVILLLWPREQCINRIGQESTPTNLRGQSENEVDWLAIPRIVMAIALLAIFTFALACRCRASLFQPYALPPQRLVGQ